MTCRANYFIWLNSTIFWKGWLEMEFRLWIWTRIRKIWWI